MRGYKSDPHWIVVKFKRAVSVHCKRAIHPGERASYYPEYRSVYCEADECRNAASASFRRERSMTNTTLRCGE